MNERNFTLGEIVDTYPEARAVVARLLELRDDEVLQFDPLANEGRGAFFGVRDGDDTDHRNVRELDPLTTDQMLVEHLEWMEGIANKSTCAFCVPGQPTPEKQREIQEHITTCERHPYAALLAAAAEMTEALEAGYRECSYPAIRARMGKALALDVGKSMLAAVAALRADNARLEAERNAAVAALQSPEAVMAQIDVVRCLEAKAAEYRKALVNLTTALRYGGAGTVTIGLANAVELLEAPGSPPRLHLAADEKREEELARLRARVEQATRFDRGNGVTVERHHVPGESTAMEWRIHGALHACGASAWEMERDTYPTAAAAFDALEAAVPGGRGLESK